MEYNLRTGLMGGQVVIKGPPNIYKLRDMGQCRQVENCEYYHRKEKYKVSPHIY